MLLRRQERDRKWAEDVRGLPEAERTGREVAAPVLKTGTWKERFHVGSFGCFLAGAEILRPPFIWPCLDAIQRLGSTVLPVSLFFPSCPKPLSTLASSFPPVSSAYALLCMSVSVYSVLLCV